MPHAADPRVESWLVQQHGVDVISLWYKDAKDGKLGHTATLQAIRKSLGSANSRTRSKLKMQVLENRQKIASLERDAENEIASVATEQIENIFAAEEAARNVIMRDDDWTRLYLMRTIRLEAQGVVHVVEMQLRVNQKACRREVLKDEAAERRRLLVWRIARGQLIGRSTVEDAEKSYRTRFDGLFQESWRRARYAIRCREKIAAARRKARAEVMRLTADAEPAGRNRLTAGECAWRASIRLHFTEGVTREALAYSACASLFAAAMDGLDSVARCAVAREEAAERLAVVRMVEQSARFVYVLEQWSLREAYRMQEEMERVYVYPSHHAVFSAAAVRVQHFVRLWARGSVGRTATREHYAAELAGLRSKKVVGTRDVALPAVRLTEENLRNHQTAASKRAEEVAAVRLQCFVRRICATKEIEGLVQQRAAAEAAALEEEGRLYLDDCARIIQLVFMRRLGQRLRRAEAERTAAVKIQALYRAHTVRTSTTLPIAAPPGPPARGSGAAALWFVRNSVGTRLMLHALHKSHDEPLSHAQTKPRHASHDTPASTPASLSLSLSCAESHEYDVLQFDPPALLDAKDADGHGVHAGSSHGLQVEECQCRAAVYEAAREGLAAVVAQHAACAGGTAQHDASCVMGRCYRSFAARQKHKILMKKRALLTLERRELSVREDLENDWLQSIAHLVISVSM
eukprot:TRINITY_DN19466_c0_g1_i1.p1 TRINITY_DN19466_c0_g1~~TRINITY_DN19466_c0_g1_i1.p1  ORF type:complete len:773 (+),score=73.43 TRINITY_DN19466_c0_g1_i1:252-2321(+)